MVIAGGSGHVGRAIQNHFDSLGWKVLVLSRTPTRPGDIAWDGSTLGNWVDVVDGCNVVVNMAGRSVNCRYTRENLSEMRRSRVDSTRVVGRAISTVSRPPSVWLQASTATIYAHRFDAANDDTTGILGGDEPGSPPKWRASIEIAKAWEAELDAAETPRTRKLALRSAMTMQPVRGSVLGVLVKLAKRGLLGTIGDGHQFVSWVHITDFLSTLEFLISHEQLSGPVNICAPNPLPMAEFTWRLREAVGAKYGLPMPKPVLEVGAFLMGTETELMLKSRRVVPGRLSEHGFSFKFRDWPVAAADLVSHPFLEP
jgi:uncharacterized protein (TIGR01777 family)